MKLQVIRFFNINSLKGKHEIVFDKEPLRSAGLFAITGATGAGKSTILDVITLALYNYIPRLGKISKSGIEKMGSIVTHFTDEAWAEVEYESGDKKYLSRWSISKTRNDTFRDYEMDIIKLPEQNSLGLKKSEVPDKNAEIIGLNVDQFLKSILLSQGDFSRFLQAKKEDRTKLLQEITGTKIYQELGQMAFELVKDRKAEIELLESNKSMIPVLSEEDVRFLDLNKNNLSETIDKNKNLLEKQEVLISLYKKKENLEKATVLISQKKGHVEEQENDFKQYLPLLEKHHEAKDYESQILAFENASKEIERISKDIEEVKGAQVNSVNLINKSIADATTLIHKQCSKESIYEDLIEFQQKINALDNSLDKYKSQGEIVRTEIINTQNDSNVLWVKTLGSKNKPSDSISAIEIRLQEIPINADESFNDLQASWSNKQSSLNSLKIYHEEYSKAKSFRVEIQRDEVWKKQADEKVLEDQSQYKKSLHREIEIEKLLNEKKHARDELSKISSLKDFSHLVKENQPCPLCGSVHHPNVFHDSLSELEKLDLVVAKLEREHRSIEESTKQYLKNVDQLKLSISSKENQLAILNEQLQNKLKLLDSQTKENPWLLEITVESWKQTIETYAQEIELLNRKIKHFQENQLLQQLLTKYRELQSIGIDYLKIKTGRDTLYEGKNITLDSDYIQNAFTKAVSEHEAAIRQEQKLLKSLKENEQIRIETTATLKPLLEKYKLTHSNEARSLIINNPEYRSIIEKREQLISTRSSVETLQNELQKIQQEYALLLKNIDKESLLSFENASRSLIEEQQQKLKEILQENNKEFGVLIEKSRTNLEALQQVSILEKEIADKRENSKTWILLNELIGDAKGKKFANFAQNLTLMHLLNRANARLASLTDRYLLSFKSEEEDLLIVDKYQGDTLRTVKTLSGGETFIISLALALSLSDFAAQSIKLESLFIDEGFGTLDQQTLDLAMTTLEKLQHNSGKRIGIISHVESLKERIQTQVVVQKNARGYSSIEIIPK